MPIDHLSCSRSLKTARANALLLVVSGPIASGKSTVARIVAGLCEQAGRSSAVIDLDEIWHMVDHETPRTGGLRDWIIARRAAAALTDTFYGAGINVVVIEGPFFTPEERDGYLSFLRTKVTQRFVTLDVSFEEAHLRAYQDPHPDRERSRDREWLAERHAASRALFDVVPQTDLTVSTDGKSAKEVAEEIAAAIGVSRLGP